MSTTNTTVILCFGSRTECWNCGGHTRAIDFDTGTPGPFPGDDRFCSEDCYVEFQERIERDNRERALRLACCPECGFDNQEHDKDCSHD